MTPWTTARIGPSPTLSVDQAGSGDLLVLLHGIGGNKRNWYPNLAALGKYWHAVAWDARGYGESEDYDGPLDFLDFSSDLERVLDHFGAAKAHVVGLSMGGRIALDFVARHPERVRTLTLCDTHTGFADWPEEKKREFVQRRREPLERGLSPADIAVSVARSLCSPSASPEAVDALVDSVSRLHKASYIKCLEASTMSPPHGRPGDIKVPTHVIVGGDDPLTTPPMCRELADKIPGARFTIIPGAGHLSNIERPDEFNAAVIDFIRSVEQK